MKTYSAKTTPDGRLIAFEIENIYVGISAIAGLFQQISAITDVNRRRLFAGESDIHVRFKYGGQPCVVWEPYGDSSRYWIGAETPDAFTANLQELRTIFDRYNPPIHRLLIGNILSLRFFK